MRITRTRPISATCCCTTGMRVIWTASTSRRCPARGCRIDIELAGAQLLGRDAARICHRDTGARIRALLDSDALVEQLIVQMPGARFSEDLRKNGPRTCWHASVGISRRLIGSGG